MTANDLRFSIMIEHKVDDKCKIIEAFKWFGPEADGIARAKEEAPRFGINLVRVWAEKL
jgi:hypothetical protein